MLYLLPMKQKSPLQPKSTWNQRTEYADAVAMILISCKSGFRVHNQEMEDVTARSPQGSGTWTAVPVLISLDQILETPHYKFDSLSSRTRTIID